MVRTKRLRDRLDAPSRAKFLVWRAFERAGHPRDVVVKIDGGPRLLLRARPASDVEIAYELFREDVYRVPVERVGDDVRCVVDLGANAGYAIAYFAWHLPRAHFIAFEPNPTLVRALYRNIQINGLESRVTVHPAAASVTDGELDLTDAEAESSLLVRPGVPTVKVRAEDFFSAIGTTRVDLLKMDVEGAEYPLMSDPRFAALSPRAIVMEWHSTDDHPDGRRWCTERLEQLGYRVDPYKDLSERTGMIFAVR
jgi:FkbM family methyltransferase